MVFSQSPDKFQLILKQEEILKNNFEIRFITAFDIGGLYDDAFGLAVGISRSF